MTQQTLDPAAPTIETVKYLEAEVAEWRATVARVSAEAATATQRASAAEADAQMCKIENKEMRRELVQSQAAAAQAIRRAEHAEATAERLHAELRKAEQSRFWTTIIGTVGGVVLGRSTI